MQPRKPFFKYTCQACGWSNTNYQRSDAPVGIRVCDKCGGEIIARVVSNLPDLGFVLQHPKEALVRVLKARFK